MSLKTTFAEINNAVLDLQASDYNTFDRPLKKLALALNADPLKAVNEQLIAGVDFDAFVEGANKGGSLAGSASLNWPNEREKELGLALVLIQRGAENPDWFMDFGHHWYYSGNKLIAGIRKMTGSVIIPFARDYKNYVEANAAPEVKAMRAEPIDKNRVFIVHGHDDAAREMVARFITTVGLEPVILHEQANKGATVPEKLIANSNVGFAVVLLTPDDVGRSKAKAEADNQPRARQNVLLELGYFVGKLGREKVCALKRGDLEIPSDYVGVVWTDFDDAGGWRMNLGRELQAAGYEIDWNRVMR